MYFLSSTSLEKNKEEKGFWIFTTPPPLRIPGHSPDAYNGVSGTSPRKFLKRNGEMLYVLVIVLTRFCRQ